MAKNRSGRPRADRPWIKDVKTVRVHSCADGNMKVDPAWLQEPVEFGAAPVGMPTRTAFASFCEKTINDALDPNALSLELASLREGCAEFVRLQKEICELLNEDSEGDSIALHDRIIWGIKALRERADQPGEEHG